MQIMTLIVAFTDELLGHVGDDVVLLGMHSHDAAMLRHFRKHGPQVAIGHTQAGEGGEDLKTGNALLYRFANLSKSGWDDTASQDVMEGKIRIRMAAKDVTPAVDLCRDRRLG